MRLGRVSIVATVGALAAPVVAGSGDQATGKDERVAAVALGRAAGTAESSTGGRAVRAEYRSRVGTTIVQVDVIEGEAMLEPRIDAGSGKVPATTGRDDGRDGPGEGDDGGGEKE